MSEAIDFSEEWLKEKAREMAGEVLLYLESYEFTGFAIWKEGAFRFPKAAPEWRTSEYWEARLFSAEKEWHCWSLGEGQWMARAATSSEWQACHLERRYVLWGRDEKKAKQEGDWAWLSEANGICIAVPFRLTKPVSECPVRLVVWEKIDYDTRNGLAHISDAMFRGFDQKEG